MKRIIVICNPKSAPVKLPADIKYFYVSSTSKMGDTKIKSAIGEWAEKERMVVTQIETVDILPQDIGEHQRGPVLEDKWNT